jgi:hypothetical protein
VVADPVTPARAGPSAAMSVTLTRVQISKAQLTMEMTPPSTG